MLLKNLSKKIGVGVLILSMLLGTLGVDAKHPEKVYHYDTAAAVFEMDFDGYATASGATTKGIYRKFGENSDIEFMDYMGWGSSSAAIKEKTDASDKYFSAIIGSGIKAKFKPDVGSTVVTPGDIIRISFKYNWIKFTGGSGGGPNSVMGVNLNDITNYRFENISGSCDASSTEEYATLATMVPFRGMRVNVTAGDNPYDDTGIAMPDFSENTVENIVAPWSDVMITINTADANADGAQTLKIETNGSTIYGKYDANYTGTNDSTIDPFTYIDSVYFDSMGHYDANRAEFMLDDLKVDILRSIADTVYVSDLITTLTDEDFSELTCNESISFWQSNKEFPVSGTSLTGSWTGSSGSFSADDPDGGNGALKVKVPSVWSEHKLYLDDRSNKNLELGDALVYKFDYYREKAIGGFYINLANGDNYARVQLLSGGWIGSQNRRNNSTTIGMFNNNTLFPGRDGGDIHAPQTDAGKWYTVELIINTSDFSQSAVAARIGGCQTITLKMIDKQTGETVNRSYGTLDANPTNDYYDAGSVDYNEDPIDTLTSYDGISLTFGYGSEESTYYIDNVSAQIVKKGIEAFGEAVDGISADDSKFVSGKTISVQAIAGMEDFDGDNNNVNIFIAQYGARNHLLDVQLIQGEADGKIIKLDDITPLADTTSIKLFMMEDDTLAPLVEAVTYTQLNSSDPAD